MVTCTVADGKASYSVISTIMITLDASNQLLGKMGINGSCAKTAKAEVAFAGEKDPHQFHLRNLGRMIEDNEDKLRNDVTESYISKQRQITNSGRLLEEYMTKDEKSAFQAELAAAQAKMQKL